MSIIITWLINLTRAVGNGWRQLLRRRVDYVWIELSGALPEFVAMPPWWQRRFMGAREHRADQQSSHRVSCARFVR